MADDSDIYGEKGELDLTPTKTILNGLRAYGPFIAAGWIGFEIARRKLERAYYVRENSPETATPTTVMARNAGAFQWIVPLYRTSDDVILQTCGMDTLFFLRFLRLCQKVAWLVIGMSAVLFPIYFYAQRHDKFDALYKMTLSHLDSDNDDQRWRFWFTVLGMYLVSGFVCFLLHREFNVYVRRRHEFLSRKTTQQYTVVVNGLPKHLRTQQTLRNYMDVLFPGSVVDVYVALECGDLEKLVAERVKVRDRLEYALALSAKNGERVMVKKGAAKCCGGEKVDAIELYQEQLKNLNDAVEMEVRSILRNQAAIANQVADTNFDDGTENELPTLQVGHSEEVSVVDEYRQTETDYIKGLRKLTGVFGMTSDNIMRSTGFVTFNKLRAAQAAQQVLQCRDPTEMHIEAAAHVEDIVWENVGLSLNTKQYWGLISMAASGWIILFWTIPTSFVVTLSKVDSLRKDWPWLDRFANDHTWVAPLLQQLSPLMLSVMNALAPIIFGILSKREGHASAAEVEKSLLNKLVIYQWYVVLLLPILGGTFLDSLLGKSKLDFNAVIKQISEQLPVQSSFYTTFLMVQMGLPTSLALLRVTPIIKAAIYHYAAPKLTPRQRSTPWLGLSPLSVPGNFGPTDPIAQYFLVFILIVVFSVVAPIFGYFAAAYLFLSEILYRWEVLCIDDPSINTGAVYWPSLYRFCMGALIFAQVLMAVLMGLKKAAAAATAALILPFLTGVFHLFVWSRYPRTAKNLPLDECVAVDQRRSRQLDDLVKSLDEHYRQPAMAERAPIYPDYAELASDPNGEHQISSPPPEYM